MKLTLNNIGKIENAVIELNGITVIAGENNTGKSTVGKALYSVINSCNNYKKLIYDTRIISINNLLSIIGKRIDETHSRNKIFSAKDILNNSQKYISDTLLLETYIKDCVKNHTGYDSRILDNDIADIAKRIVQLLKVSDSDILKRIVLYYFSKEFNGQINNIYTNDTASIEFDTNIGKIAMNFNESTVTNIEGVYEPSEKTVYIDNPFVLDEGKPMFVISNAYGVNHKDDLIAKIHTKLENVYILNDIVVENKLNNVYKLINRVCAGDVVKNEQNASYGYKIANSDKVLNVKNLSTGLKTFAIIKTLLKNGTLNEKSVLILDEPEIHLHPQWQMMFAELIVLIQKEFNMRILLNTHSPYFMKAIEVYTAKYAIADKCRYYLSYMNGDISQIRDVTENTEDIYKLLARPLQELENVRYNNE